MEVNFGSEEEMQAFKARLKRVRKLVSPGDGGEVDNVGLLGAMMDAVESKSSTRDQRSSTSTGVAAGVAMQSFLRNSGIYTGDSNPEDKELFVAERHCLLDLLTALSTPCPCGVTGSPWTVDSIIQKGHVVRVLFVCRRCHQQKRTWASSRIFSGHYLINQKVVHSFSCAGVLEAQYTKFCKFALLGHVGHKYVKQVYERRGYVSLVAKAAETSMQSAVEDVVARPEYATDGEWVIMDARHDSTANAYHTTVPCLSGSTQKIMGISTISRTGHGVAQTRELQCTKTVLPAVIARGVDVREVAHDMQAQVTRFVTTELKLLNSYDTWHGTKNVTKQLKKITQGLVRDRGIKWFTELGDKRKSVKTHLYWAMKNCDGCAEMLRKLIEIIPDHYQGDHSGCHSRSSCHKPHYVPGKEVIEDPNTAAALLKNLKESNIYKHAEAFSRCRDTYWVESFNHQLLIYLPKRIHFSTKVFDMRMSLALLDWNENVNRPYTSQSKVHDLRRPDRHGEMKVHVDKTFHFVDMLWEMYIAHNTVDLRPAHDVDEVDTVEDLFHDGDFVGEYDSSDSEDEETIV